MFSFKKLCSIICITFYSCLFFAVCSAPPLSADELATQTETLCSESFESQNVDFHSISNNGTAIVSETDGQNLNFYLCDLESRSKELLFRCPPKTRVKFSDDCRYIVKQLLEKTNTYAEIFDTQTGEVKILQHKDGQVVAPSISQITGDVLYQLREFGVPPKIFCLKKGESEPIFMTEGIGQSWSPDGKWFAVNKVKHDDVHPKKNT